MENISAYDVLCKGKIFKRVQNSNVYDDCKTFVDSTPKVPPAVIAERYRNASEKEDFSLYDFITENFTVAPEPRNTEQKKSVTMKEHIESLWPMLTRSPDTVNRQDTYIPLPYEYVVPGGRFKEIYYWDSYFTALGLLGSERKETIMNMIKNFAFLIEKIGHVPNGNRLYYLTRSQPPFFACMLTLIEKEQGIEQASAFTKTLEKEYGFWMKGAELVNDNMPDFKHVVRMKDGTLLNRYWDDVNIPRPESYREDIELFSKQNVKNPNLYRDIRAACESGWDFSSRWLGEASDLSTIETTQIAPIDLNCLMYHMEDTLSRYFKYQGNSEKAAVYQQKATQRAEAINTCFFDKASGFYHDMHWKDQALTYRSSLAAMYPLFFGLCTKEQACAVAENIKNKFLVQGGLVTTPVTSGQQWDSPNGWAPLHWIAVTGLRRYGFDSLANTIKSRWLNTNEQYFRQTGKMMERYNVMNSDDVTFGGEYPAQDGFGWSNAVASFFLQEEDCP